MGNCDSCQSQSFPPKYNVEDIANRYNIIVENMGKNIDRQEGLRLLGFGIEAELEHGSKFAKKFNLPDEIDVNVTHDDIDTTIKIVLAHLIEDPWYYQRLEKMERASDTEWRQRQRPQIIRGVIIHDS